MESTVREVVQTEGESWTRRLTSLGLDEQAADRLVIAAVAELALAAEGAEKGPGATALAKRLAPRLGLSRRRTAACLAVLLPAVSAALARRSR